MKKTLSLMTVSLLTCTTIATASPSDTMNFSTLNQSDSHMLFGQNTHNVVMLNQDEMKNTEGEWGFWGAIAGAITAAYGYFGYASTSGSWSWSRLGMAATQGAITGFLLPTPTAIRWTATRYSAMGAGATTGYLWR